MQLAIVRADSLTGSLTPAEQHVLASIRGPRRREEWIRGRLAAHRLVDSDVLVDPDGAPRIDGGHISLSHDGAWIAVAVAPRPIGVDLCLRTHADRITKVLRWLEVESDDVDPVAQWAALEAVLKLRRLAIEQLRERTIAIRVGLDERGLVVRGIGDDVLVRITTEPEFVVATCG